jgi:hypothetical protein
MPDLHELNVSKFRSATGLDPDQTKLKNDLTMPAVIHMILRSGEPCSAPEHKQYESQPGEGDCYPEPKDDGTARSSLRRSVVPEGRSN